VPNIKPSQKHKYNKKKVKIHKNKTPNGQNKNNIAGKSNIKDMPRQKQLQTPQNTGKLILKKPHIIAVYVLMK
jgi:hypothetical protein